eukprot:Hpha_TRINITY_DN15988_c2_g3::TRINITY_DN15988_c2_g3_i2::g.70408::m.70408
MQNGVRHLRRVVVYYANNVPRYEPQHGGVVEWVNDWLPKFRERRPEIEVVLHPLNDPRLINTESSYPRVEGEYLSGTLSTWLVGRKSAEAVDMVIGEMCNTLNAEEPRPHIGMVIETNMESVQGMWTPYLWMKDKPAPKVVDWHSRWVDELQDIAKYVREKKTHREKDFARKHWLSLGVRKRMQKRWDEEVFPYTVGPQTRAVPGRLHMDDTRSIFQDPSSTPRDEDLSPQGGAFMGGFVSPYRGGEEASASIGGTGTGDTNKFDAKRYGSGAVKNVPAFSGAPFTTGYGDYENFWKNWDLFHFTSGQYDPRKETPHHSTPPEARASESRSWTEETRRLHQHFKTAEKGRSWDHES